MLTGFVIGDRGLAAAGDTHPLWMAAHATVGQYLIVGASAVGQLHLKRELPRDDAFVIRSSGPWLAAAVSDGVGSRPFSRFGATYVAEALTSLLLRPLSPPLKGQAPLAGPATLAALSGWTPPGSLEEIEWDPTVATVRRAAGAGGLAGGSRKKFARQADAPGAGLVDEAIEQAASIGWWSRPPAINLERTDCPTKEGAPDAESGRPAAAEADPHPTDLVSVMRQAFVKTHLGLREHAASIGLELADLGCTALGLLLNVETGCCVAGQVGDGALLGLTALGRMRELVEAPDTGDPQSVYTINHRNFQDYLTIQSIEPPAVNAFVAYLVMSDGVSSDLLFSPKQDVVDRWAQTVDRNLRTSASPAQAAAGVLNWLATYRVKGSWDDRTLIVVTQRKRDDGSRQPATERS